jgi:hypothetical protein
VLYPAGSEVVRLRRLSGVRIPLRGGGLSQNPLQPWNRVRELHARRFGNGAGAARQS